MKRAFWILAIALVLLLGWLIYANQELASMVKGLTTIVHDQEIRIQSAEKQIPNVVRYTAIVRELTDKAKDKLTAHEIVEMARVIIIECQEHSDIGLTPDLILGLIERESAFNPRALSTAHAYGISQCLKGTFEQHLPAFGYAAFSEELAYNPIVNLQVGIAEMVRLRRLFLENGIESWLPVLSSYFWGEKNIWMLMTEKKRAMLPSLEYGQGVLNLASQYKSRGIL